MKKLIRRLANKFGYDIIRSNNHSVRSNSESRPDQPQSNSSEFDIPADFADFEKMTIHKVKPFTMTSPERIASLIHAVRYIVDANIEGSIVECGVWRGGSMMTIALTLLEKRSLDKDLYLFDTFEGMSPASAADVSITGDDAQHLMSVTRKSEDDHLWAYSPLIKVQEAVLSTGYPKEKILFIKGMVEETIPTHAPSRISLLRLDTDWYESTRHELVHLFPRLSVGGVLIIDDYGHWKGAKKAVDEYIAEKKLRILLNRIDYTGRIAIKQ
jgi:O-methyltransferase